MASEGSELLIVSVHFEDRSLCYRPTWCEIAWHKWPDHFDPVSQDDSVEKQLIGMQNLKVKYQRHKWSQPQKESWLWKFQLDRLTTRLSLLVAIFLAKGSLVHQFTFLEMETLPLIIIHSHLWLRISSVWMIKNDHDDIKGWWSPSIIYQR